MTLSQYKPCKALLEQTRGTHRPLNVSAPHHFTTTTQLFSLYIANKSFRWSETKSKVSVRLDPSLDETLVKR